MLIVVPFQNVSFVFSTTTKLLIIHLSESEIAPKAIKFSSTPKYRTGWPLRTSNPPLIWKTEQLLSWIFYFFLLSHQQPLVAYLRAPSWAHSCSPYTCTPLVPPFRNVAHRCSSNDTQLYLLPRLRENGALLLITTITMTTVTLSAWGSVSQGRHVCSWFRCCWASNSLHEKRASVLSWHPCLSDTESSLRFYYQPPVDLWSPRILSSDVFRCSTLSVEGER